MSFLETPVKSFRIPLAPQFSDLRRLRSESQSIRLEVHRAWKEGIANSGSTARGEAAAIRAVSLWQVRLIHQARARHVGGTGGFYSLLLMQQIES